MPNILNKNRPTLPPSHFSSSFPQTSHGLATLSTRIKKAKIQCIVCKAIMIPQYINHTPSQNSSIQAQTHISNNNQSRIQDHEKKSTPKFPVEERQETQITKMISARKVMKMARKWQNVAALRRKRISLPAKIDDDNTSDHSSEMAEKGHFIVYTTDRVRFSFPIAYLNSLIFRELLRMSEEEFGLPSNGPITLPCDSQLLRYVTSLMQKKAAKDVEKALLLSMAACSCRCSSSHTLHQRQQTSHHMLLSGC